MAHANPMPTKAVLILGLAAGLLASCANTPQGIRVTNEGAVLDSDAGKKPQSIRNLSGKDIYSAIAGKTFQYTRPNGNGFVTYKSNGTFEFQDDVNGPGTGRWTVKGSEFCETFGAKAATECGDFKSTGDAYFAASSRLVEMKV